MLKMSPTVLVRIADVLNITGWAYETRITNGKVVEWEDELYCKYGKDRYTATIYGVSAMAFLLASHLLTMLASRCLCFTKGYAGSRFCPVLLFVSAWVTFIIAEICLLEGSIMNAIDHPEYARVFKESSPSCETLIMRWIFPVAAISLLLTSIISRLYYFVNINTGDDTGVRITNV